MFVILGLSTIIPFIVMCFMDKGSVMVDQIWLYGVGGAIYIFGAYLYAVRLPEKNHPGKFDICGSSH